MKPFVTCFAAIFVLSVAAAKAQVSYPMLMSIKPVAAQVGQTTEHEVAARYNLYGAFKILVSGAGVSGEIVPPEKPLEGKDGAKPTQDKIKVRFHVAADAQPGVRDFRIATPQGVSTIGQLVVGRDPVVSETGKNDALPTAQGIEVPATVCGAIEAAEDVDFYKFKVPAGAALSFHVRCARLEDKIHDLQTHADPLIALRNSSGTILEQVDNYFYGDPLLNYRFEKEGEYYLEIRDVRYQGNAYWNYSIEISDRPFVTNVFPLAVAPGGETKLQAVGFQLPAEPQALIQVPADVPDGPMFLSLPMGNAASNPAPLIASRLPVALESADDNSTPEKAQAIELPAALSGRIEAEGDLDYFAFEAKKGDALTIEIMARRQQSMLDSVLRILDEKGKQLAENDDLNSGRHVYADSLVENWKAPADGRFLIEVRDLHLRGGPEFVYLLSISRAEPTFTLEADTDKTVLAPGLSAALFVRAYRKNGFDGEIQLAVEGLPPGVTAHCGRILADGKDGCIVFTAASDAALAAENIRITGQGSMKGAEGQEPMTITATARPLQETYMPGGGRGHYPVETHTLSVGEPLDIRLVKVSATEIRLKPGESKKIEIALERAEGFDKNVTLDCMYRHLSSVYGDSLPKGVTIDLKQSKTLLTGKQATGHITLTADKDAKPVEKQQICMMANVAINFVMKMTYASEPILVSVEAP